MLATHPAGLSYLTYGLSSNALAVAEWLIIPNSYFPECMAGHSFTSSWLKAVSLVELISGLAMLTLILSVGAVKGLRLLGDSPLLTKLKTL